MTEHDQEEQRGPDQEPRTGGVAVHRYVDGMDPGELARYFPTAGFRLDPWDGMLPEPGTWFPLAEAEALEAIVAALAQYDEGRGTLTSANVAYDHLRNLRLAALRGAKFVPPAAQRREPDGNSDTGAMREPSGGTSVFRSKP